MMSATVILLAIVGSVASKANTVKSPQVTVPGYYNPNPAIPNPCNLVIQCNNIAGPICTITVGGQSYQAFGKVSPNDTVCEVTLYRNI